ncbi:MAG: HU family DNA-binding protein [Flavobacterium sp.]|jgi:DNA-binding protein HU-beta
MLEKLFFKFIYLQPQKIIQIIISKKMTKADIVAKISEKLGLEKGDVQATVESFMEEVKNSLESGDNVYLRGFGSFIIKTRAEKTGRNISKNTTIKIPAHNIPAFKPAKVFVEGVKTKTEVAVS